MGEEYEVFAKKMETAYPKMFEGKYGGFAVSKGWWPILEKLCAGIQHHIDWKEKQYQWAVNYNEVAQAGKSGNAELFGDLVAKEYAEKPGIGKDYIRERCKEMIKNPLRDVPELVPQVVVEQIKEKFGGLRFYYQGGNEYIHGLVSMAESWADVACEECGAIGKKRNGGWIRTLCDFHEAEHQERKRTQEMKSSGFEE